MSARTGGIVSSKSIMSMRMHCQDQRVACALFTLSMGDTLFNSEETESCTDTENMDAKHEQFNTEEDPAVTNFREYLRYKTVEPNPDYGEHPLS